MRNTFIILIALFIIIMVSVLKGKKSNVESFHDSGTYLHLSSNGKDLYKTINNEIKEKCKPGCHWKCDNPVCPQVCKPKCNKPECHVRCKELPPATCTVKCDKPKCRIECGKGCVKKTCPPCVTKCDPPVCHVKCCKPKPKCVNVCRRPRCTWECRKPENCPKPKCEMVCEDKNDSNVDVIHDRYGFHNDLKDYTVTLDSH